MSKKKRIDNFQGLRGYAIILIFISHCNIAENLYGESITSWLGGLGVSLFVMLSGYLLAYQKHESEQTIPLTTLKRRLKRFYPLHIVTFIIALPFSISSFLHNGVIKQFVKLILNITLLQTWIPSSSVYFSFNSVSWYLSLTVFFILVSTISLRLLKKVSLKVIPYVNIFILSFELIWCFLVKNLSIAHWLVYILPAVRYFDYFAGGVLYIFVASHKRMNSRIIDLVFIISVASIIVLFLLSINSNSEYFSTAFWFIPSTMMVAATATGNKNSVIIDKVFSNKAIQYMGNISFEFFLIHQLVIKYLSIISNRVLKYNGVVIYLIAFICSVFASIIWQSIMKKVLSEKKEAKV